MCESTDAGEQEGLCQLWIKIQMQKSSFIRQCIIRIRRSDIFIHPLRTLWERSLENLFLQHCTVKNLKWFLPSYGDLCYCRRKVSPPRNFIVFLKREQVWKSQVTGNENPICNEPNFFKVCVLHLCRAWSDGILPKCPVSVSQDASGQDQQIRSQKRKRSINTSKCVKPSQGSLRNQIEEAVWDLQQSRRMQW